MMELSALTIQILINALVVGLFAGLKIYSNKIGDAPEDFNPYKAAPIFIISFLVSIGLTLGYGEIPTADALVQFVTANFTLVVITNTLFSMFMKKYFPDSKLIATTTP